MKRFATAIVTLFLVLIVSLAAEGKRLTLRPMSAHEVHQVLRGTGREAAIPEGRMIMHGIAALKGFALGVKTGVAGALLVDLVTSNPLFNESSLLGNVQSFNLNALTHPFRNTNKQVNTQMQMQEICFSTRRSLQLPAKGRQSATTAATAEATPASSSTDTTAPTTTGSSSSTSNTPTTTMAQSPTTDTLNSPTSTGFAQSGSGTVTTTQPDSGGTLNCIVIEKPVSVRRRRGLPGDRKRTSQFPLHNA